MQGLRTWAGHAALAVAVVLGGCGSDALEVHALHNPMAGGRTILVVPERVFGRRSTGLETSEITQREQDVRDARIELATEDGRVLAADTTWAPEGGAYFAEVLPGHRGAWRLELPCDLPPDVPQTLRVRALEPDGSVRLEGTLEHTCYEPRTARWLHETYPPLPPIPDGARFVRGSRLPGQLIVGNSEGINLSFTGVTFETTGVEVVPTAVAPSGNVWRSDLELRTLGRGVRVAVRDVRLELPLEAVPEGPRPLALSPWYAGRNGNADLLYLRAHWVDADGQPVYGGGLDQCVWTTVTTTGERVTGPADPGRMDGDCTFGWIPSPAVPQLREVCVRVGGQEACRALP